MTKYIYRNGSVFISSRGGQRLFCGGKSFRSLRLFNTNPIKYMMCDTINNNLNNNIMSNIGETGDDLDNYVFLDDAIDKVKFKRKSITDKLEEIKYITAKRPKKNIKKSSRVNTLKKYDL